MLGKRTNVLTSIAFAALLAASAAAPPANAASNDETFFDGLVEDSEVGIAEQALIQVSELTGWIARKDVPFVGSDSKPGNATQYARDFEQEFNQHNGSIESYASNRLNADTNHDVFAVYFHDKAGHNVTRYVVSDVVNGSWQNARAVNETEFQSLNRSVDHWVSLDWYQSRHAAGELDQFVTDYASTGDDLPAGYRAKLLAKYGAPQSDMWGANRSSA